MLTIIANNMLIIIANNMLTNKLLLCIDTDIYAY